MKELEIITTESFREAGGREKFPTLIRLETVYADHPSNTISIQQSASYLNQQLAKEALQKGGTAVFGIRYVSTGYKWAAYGEAYGPNERETPE